MLDEFADLLPRRNAPDWNAIGDRPRERRRWGPEFDKRSAAELDEERAAHPEKFRSPQRRGLRALPDQGVGAQRLSPRRINMSLAPTSDPSDLQNHEAFRFRNQRLNAAGNRVKRSLGGRWFLPRVRTWDAFHDPEIRDLYLRVWGDDADGLAGAQQTVRDWAFVKSDHANQIAMREAFGAIAEGRAPAGELGRRIEMLYQTRRERWARLADELGIPVPEKFRAWRGLGGDNGPLFVEAIVNAWRQPGDDPIVLPSHTLTSWSLNAKAATAFATNYGRSRTAGVIVEADIPFENTLMDKWVDDSAFVMPWAFQDEVIAATPRPDSLRAFKQSAVVYYQGTRYAYADREALFQAWDSNRPR